ncbi:hypothetical protein BV898_08418 [Hypsibius exemplaris]|uniref:VWFC domain-containing protein n=1 Tax=Hypsibius exemplaris TaxID=2072580 RepID=A0A1W0WQK2_HYPEX|nr:hypothetical protein BV898_08418 [Hypsibius exemplaris]
MGCAPIVICLSFIFMESGLSALPAPGAGSDLGVVMREREKSRGISKVTFCWDYQGNRIQEGGKFIPNETDACMECDCVNGEAQMCVASVCSLPHDCRDVRKLFTDQCCKFVCFDRKWRNLHYGVQNYSEIGAQFRDTYLVPHIERDDFRRHEDDDPHGNYMLRLGFTTMTTILILVCLMLSIHRLRSRRLRALLARQSAFDAHPYGPDAYDEVDGRHCGHGPDCDGVLHGFARSDPPPPAYKQSPSLCDLPPTYDDVVQSEPRGPLNVNTPSPTAGGTSGRSATAIESPAEPPEYHSSPSRTAGAGDAPGVC